MALLSLIVACVPVLTSPPGTVDSTLDWTAPTNSWPTETPPDNLEAEGFANGEVPPDFLFKDQYGADVALWQFYGHPIVLDISTGWCSPCQDLAEEAQAMVDDYADVGLVYVTLMPQNVAGDVPEQGDLQEWSEDFELNQPVLSDDSGYSYQIVVGDDPFPAVLIIGDDMRVVKEVGSPSDATIRAAIEDAL